MATFALGSRAMKNPTQKSAALIGAGAVGLVAGAQAEIHFTDAGDYTGPNVYFDFVTGQYGADLTSVPGADFYLSASQTTGQDINPPKNTKTKDTYTIFDAAGDPTHAISYSLTLSGARRFALNETIDASGSYGTESAGLYASYAYDGDGTGTPPPPTEWSPSAPTDQGYVGVQFGIAGEIHYGWADITLNNDLTFSLAGFAYEDVPNRPVLAGSMVSVPEPASAGFLIAGAAGVAALLRRRRMAQG
jgi:hypothetical protein